MAIKLYGFWRSIAAFRVRTALRLKHLPFDEVSVDILSGEQFSSDYSAINAEHVVPTLVDGANSFFQSLPIIEYLDETHPEPPLLPKDPADRAYARALAMVNIADAHPLIVPRVRGYLGQNFGADGPAIDQWAAHWIARGLNTYETMLKKRPPSPYAVGSTPGIADIGIAGHLVSAQLFKIDLAAYPTVKALGETCFANPAFMDSHPLRQPGAPQI